MDKIAQVVDLLKKAKHITALTGAGVSVASGIPPFRGANGLWNKYDPIFLDLEYFYAHPQKSWRLIKEIFYDFMGDAKPNPAHFALAQLEEIGLLEAIITQNIDNLHQKSGSKNVIEYHGNSRKLVCISCEKKFDISEYVFEQLPPICPQCKKTLKPDFIFFSEAIPEKAAFDSYEEMQSSDLLILIGTTGEIIPASYLPFQAKENGAKIIEINPHKSTFTNSITDIFIKDKVEIVLPKIMKKLEIR